MQPTLIILAAGMGSRFGGNKQIEKLGIAGQARNDTYTNVISRRYDVYPE